MTCFVERSGLPHATEKVLIGQKYKEILEKSLEKIDISAIYVPDNPYVDPRMSGHADLSVFHAGGEGIYLAPFLRNEKLAHELEKLGFKCEFPQIEQKSEYPHDAQLNACALGNTLIYSEKRTSPLVVNYFTNKGGSKLISSRQGYAACSVCAVNERSIITSDNGIAKAALRHGLDVLTITPGFVELPGFDYGFIGGASFKISEGVLAFTGRLDGHPDRHEILAFIEHRNVEPLFLTGKPIFDIGGAIQITEKHCL